MRKIFIFFLIVIFNTSCSSIDNKNINTSIINDDLIFSLPKNDFEVVYYEINSLEDFREDGISYKNILKKENDRNDLGVIIIKNYNKKNIKNKNAYYLNMVKRGNKFQTMGFCIQDNIVYIQKKYQEDKDFVQECHNLKIP